MADYIRTHPYVTVWRVNTNKSELEGLDEDFRRFKKENKRGEETLKADLMDEFSATLKTELKRVKKVRAIQPCTSVLCHM